jgi:hypothetical protein
MTNLVVAFRMRRHLKSVFFSIGYCVKESLLKSKKLTKFCGEVSCSEVCSDCCHQHCVSKLLRTSAWFRQQCGQVHCGQVLRPEVGADKYSKAIYVQRNVEARSRDHFYCGKAISITYSECVSVALVTQRKCAHGHL